MAKKPVRWDSVDKNDILFERLILEYEAHNRAEGKSPNTVLWYRTSLYLFLDFLKASDPKPTLGQVDIAAVRSYILHLQDRSCYADHPLTPAQERSLSAMTIQCYLRAIKAFFSWVQREGYTPENRLERLRAPKAPRKVIEPLSQQEVALMVSSIDPFTSRGARNLALVLLLLDTGLRIHEAAGLETKDLHLEDRYLKVMGKGQKERIVPFGGHVQKALMRWCFHFRPEPLRENRVFLNLDGQPITTNGLKLIFKRLAAASGVTRLHAHLCRHTFSVNYLMNGGDPFTLQALLGHSNLEMTKRYVNVASAHVVAQHHHASPVDRMNLRQVNRAVGAKVRNPTPRFAKGTSATSARPI